MADQERRGRAYAAARRVPDPEMPMLTVEDLGILRGVEIDPEGTVVVRITPTYSGCPALATIRDDLRRQLQQAGFNEVRVAVDLQPAWSSDWITDRGRRALAASGISPPGAAPRASGPVALNLLPRARTLTCPRCGSASAALTSEFGPTACTALYRCPGCGEPFQHVKEI